MPKNKDESQSNDQNSENNIVTNENSLLINQNQMEKNFPSLFFQQFRDSTSKLKTISNQGRNLTQYPMEQINIHSFIQDFHQFFKETQLSPNTKLILFAAFSQIQSYYFSQCFLSYFQSLIPFSNAWNHFCSIFRYTGLMNIRFEYKSFFDLITPHLSEIPNIQSQISLLCSIFSNFTSRTIDSCSKAISHLRVLLSSNQLINQEPFKQSFESFLLQFNSFKQIVKFQDLVSKYSEYPPPLVAISNLIQEKTLFNSILEYSELFFMITPNSLEDNIRMKALFMIHQLQQFNNSDLPPEIFSTIIMQYRQIIQDFVHNNLNDLEAIESLNNSINLMFPSGISSELCKRKLEAFLRARSQCSEETQKSHILFFLLSTLSEIIEITNQGLPSDISNHINTLIILYSQALCNSTILENSFNIITLHYSIMKHELPSPTLNMNYYIQAISSVINFPFITEDSSSFLRRFKVYIKTLNILSSSKFSSLINDKTGEIIQILNDIKNNETLFQIKGLELNTISSSLFIPSSEISSLEPSALASHALGLLISSGYSLSSIGDPDSFSILSTTDKNLNKAINLAKEYINFLKNVSIIKSITFPFLSDDSVPDKNEPLISQSNFADSISSLIDFTLPIISEASNESFVSSCFSLAGSALLKERSTPEHILQDWNTFITKITIPFFNNKLTHLIRISEIFHFSSSFTKFLLDPCSKLDQFNDEILNTSYSELFTDIIDKCKALSNIFSTLHKISESNNELSIPEPQSNFSISITLLANMFRALQFKENSLKEWPQNNTSYTENISFNYLEELLENYSKNYGDISSKEITSKLYFFGSLFNGFNNSIEINSFRNSLFSACNAEESDIKSALEASLVEAILALERINNLTEKSYETSTEAEIILQVILYILTILSNFSFDKDIHFANHMLTVSRAFLNNEHPKEFHYQDEHQDHSDNERPFATLCESAEIILERIEGEEESAAKNAARNLVNAMKELDAIAPTEITLKEKIKAGNRRMEVLIDESKRQIELSHHQAEILKKVGNRPFLTPDLPAIKKFMEDEDTEIAQYKEILKTKSENIEMMMDTISRLKINYNSSDKRDDGRKIQITLKSLENMKEKDLESDQKTKNAIDNLEKLKMLREQNVRLEAQLQRMKLRQIVDFQTNVEEFEDEEEITKLLTKKEILEAKLKILNKSFEEIKPSDELVALSQFILKKDVPMDILQKSLNAVLQRRKELICENIEMKKQLDHDFV